MMAWRYGDTAAHRLGCGHRQRTRADLQHARRRAVLAVWLPLKVHSQHREQPDIPVCSCCCDRGARRHARRRAAARCTCWCCGLEQPQLGRGCSSGSRGGSYCGSFAIHDQGAVGGAVAVLRRQQRRQRGAYRGQPICAVHIAHRLGRQRQLQEAPAPPLPLLSQLLRVHLKLAIQPELLLVLRRKGELPSHQHAAQQRALQLAVVAHVLPRHLRYGGTQLAGLLGL